MARSHILSVRGGVEGREYYYTEVKKDTYIYIYISKWRRLAITGSHGGSNSSEDEEKCAYELRYHGADAVRLGRLLPAAKSYLRHSLLSKAILISTANYSRMLDFLALAQCYCYRYL